MNNRDQEGSSFQDKVLLNVIEGNDHGFVQIVKQGLVGKNEYIEKRRD